MRVDYHQTKKQENLPGSYCHIITPTRTQITEPMTETESEPTVRKFYGWIQKDQ
jgi:hypothetical protein